MPYITCYIDNSKFRFMILATIIFTLVIFFLMITCIGDPGSLLGINEEQEIELVNNNPANAAQKCFTDGDIKFIEIYKYNSSKDVPSGYIVPAREKISERILKENPIRLKLRTTYNWDWNEEQKNHLRKAKSFASEFNLNMAELVAGKE